MTKNNNEEKSLQENITEEKSNKDDPYSFIDSLEIDKLQKRFIRSRWLDQMQWMSAKSKSSQKKYYVS